jgi:signal transduction histidine kinase
VPSELGDARANPERLQRVLFNLLQNAIRHTPADGSVTVRAEPRSAAIEIEVADTGAGLPAGERERIFEPFYRAGGGRARADHGAGLGLSIARAIVEAHGGRIWVAGNDAGTRVRFSLPRAA